MSSVSWTVWKPKMGFLTHYLLILGVVLLADCYGPQFPRPLPPTLTFTNDTGGVVSCVVGGEPRPTIAWVGREGTPLPLVPDLYRDMGNGTLQFFRFSPEKWMSEIHDSQIRCRATNPYGTIVSSLLHVRAVVAEHQLVQVVGEPVLKLNTGILKCQVPASLKHSAEVVSWKFGNNYIYPTKSWTSGLDIVMVPNGELHISSVDYRHTHHPYFCIIRNLETGINQESLPFHLTVKDTIPLMRPEQMSDQEFYISVEQGNIAALPCRVQSSPPPTLSWFNVRSNLLQPVTQGTRIHATAHMLVITDTQVSDSGQYRCTARNEVGETSITIHLQVEPPLVVDIVPPEQVIDIGRQARLECLTEERDRTSILWRKDGEVIPPSSNIVQNRQTLQIFNIERTNYGMYQCFVTRGNREVEARGELRLGDAEPYLVYEFIEQTLQPGPPVCLKCSSKGSPPPQIYWTKNGQDLPKSDRFMIGQYVSPHNEVISHVNISRALVEDGGLYTCTAKNRAGQAVHAARLNIYGPPLVHDLPEIKAVVGRSVRVLCPASGYPLDRITWSKDGRELRTDGKVQVFTNGTMEISTISAQDAGSYSCAASNRQGQVASKHTQLKVIVPPRIQKPGETHRSLTIDERVSLLCSVIEGDEPITMIWLKNGANISDSMEAEVNFVGHDSILRINKLGEHHIGNYSCRASNPAGDTDIFFFVEVKVPPTWINAPVSQSAIEGQSVAFPCEVRGVPTPVLKWTVKSGGDLRVYSTLGLSRRGEDMEIQDNGTLIISRAAVRDEGEYSCSAENGVGEPISTSVSLKINAPPRFMMETEGILSVHQGRPVELLCKARGDDPISISWVKGGRELVAEPGRTSITVIRELEHVTSKFEIRNARNTDSGRFECQASNPFGKSFYHIQLQIWEPPESPENLTLSSVTSRTARISWSVSQSKPKIERFVVEWKKQHESWEGGSEDKTLYGQVNDAIISGLRPALLYQVRVFAENELGRSKEGRVLQFITDGERPEGVAQNIRISPLSPTQLQVMWDQPGPELSHGAILRYNIGVREFGTDSPYMFYDVDRYHWDRTRHQFRLRRLRKFSKYEIVIQAVNRHGEGPLSDIVVGQTLEAAPEDAPEAVECLPLSSTGVHVKWRAPPHPTWNGQIRGYRVLYVPFPRRDEVPALLNTARLSAVIGTTTALSGLVPSTNYSIQVLAYTGAGDGRFSAPVSCSTEEDVPGPPRSIKVVVSGANSVVVSWLPPHHTNGEVIKYRVYVREVHFGREKSHTKYDRPASSDSFDITGLRTGTQHQFWVQALTKKGEGRSSQVVTKTPSNNPIPQITSIGWELFQAWRTPVYLPCRHIGTPPPVTRWYFQGREANWVNQASTYGTSQLSIESARSEDTGNYTCIIENGETLDSISYSLRVQVGPKPPVIRVHRVTSNSITLRWTGSDLGNSPVIGYRIRYKITYGEWMEKQVSFYAEEDTLTDLYCGRQYHMVMYQTNYIGESEASQIINTRTVGEKPNPPLSKDFLVVNSTLAILLLETWSQDSCTVLYFVIEYKLSADSTWTVVTNNLEIQDTYSIRGLTQSTAYDLKVTAHNHAGSATRIYQFITLDTLGAPTLPRGGLASVLSGLGFRASISILISVLCLVLASLGVCFCIRKKQVSKRPGRYDEIPKSSTMENRHNLDQQFYATVQRKTPALTPFSSGGYEVDTIEQLKKAVRSKIEKIPETASDISPYATSNLQTLPAGGRQHTLGRTETLTPGGRQHTLGRNETLRLSDYHRQMETMGRDTLGRQKDRDTLGRQIDRDTIGRQIDRDTLGRHRHQQQQQQQVQQQEEGGRGRAEEAGKRRGSRRRYSESEEYDSDSDSRTESSNQLDQDKFSALRYRSQFNL